ncbi:Adenylate cyclase type 10 [Irineochytrium annulatum]|nr:Adenylate cyclase type 10 [Irineochytrium annulatum]
MMVMIDISGYSNFTSVLATAGKVSSEVISSTVSKFLDNLIRILHSFGGDIIKFLGDAVLVSFCPPRSPQQHDASAKREVARRGVLCCATIMAELPCVDVDLSAYVNIGEVCELDLDTAAEEDDDHMNHVSGRANKVASRTPSTKVPSPAPRRSSTNGSMSKLSLQLHIAATCGVVDRCIIGSPNSRLEYLIHGDCLEDMKAILDSTGKGQLGVSDAAWTLSGFNHGDPVAVGTNGCIVLAGEKIASITWPAPYLERPVSPNPIQLILSDEQHYRLLKFLPTALAHRVMETRRDSSHTTMALSNEYRFITAAFVKLKWTFNVLRAQSCMTAFINSVGKHHGVFQQFAVDDKGQTMLAFFGLPPFHRGDSSNNAVEASLAFVKVWRKLAPEHGVAVSLATGEILISVLGNEIRADSTGLGDSVNLAARLLSFTDDGVVCDYTTHVATAAIGVHTFLGEHMVKGKKRPVGAWSLANDSSSSAAAPLLPKEVGYVKEKERLVSAAMGWLNGASQLLAVVEGPSGVGKTSFLNAAISVLEPHGVSISQREMILANSTLKEGVLYMDEGVVENLKFDVASGIQTQYDSLDTQTKTFFRYAACLGQYFDVAIIANIFDLDLQLENVDPWIASHDLFCFLSIAATNIGERAYFFRHISILNCIYEGISFSDRKTMHLKVAYHLEEVMKKRGSANGESDGDEFLLPLVAYHFGRTGDFQKIVKYFDALGLVYSRKYMVIECINTMEFLLAAVKARQMERAGLAQEDASDAMPSQMDIVRWKRMLADNYRLNGQHIKCVPLFREMLNSLGVYFPDGLRECKREYHKQMLLQMWLWRRAAGGKRDIKSRAKPDPDRVAFTIGTLTTFMIVLLTDDESLLVPELYHQRTLCALLMANMTVRNVISQPVPACLTFGYLAFMLMQLSPKAGTLFRKRHALLRARLRPEQSMSVFHSDLFVSMGEYVRGNVAVARQLMGPAIELGRVKHQVLYACVGQLLQTQFMWSKGESLNDAIEGLTECLAASEEFKRSSNHYLLATSSCVIARHLWFTGRDDDEANVWTRMAITQTEKIGNRFHRALYKMPLLLQEMLTGSHSDACQIYSDMAQVLQYRNPRFLDFANLSPHLIFMSLMLLFPTRYTHNQREAEPSKHRQQILHALSLLAKANKFAHKEMRSVLSLWALHAANAILSRLSNRRRVGKLGSLEKLKSMLRGKDGKKVKDWAALRGYVCATIAICDSKTNERQRYTEAAVVEFSKSFARLQVWMNALQASQ